MVRHFKTIQWEKGKEAWNQFLSRPQAHQLHWWQIHFLLWNQHTSDTSFITIASAAILTQVTIIFTSCIQRIIQRIISRAPLRELFTYKQEPSFIRPHDIDRGLTPGLSTQLQEMSPLAPYKFERSAKARARQAFSTMHWPPFKTLQR